MPTKPDDDGWVYFKPGERLEIDERTGEMRVVFYWRDWLKAYLNDYFLPMRGRILFDHEFYQRDPEWCETVLSFGWLPFPMAEWAARIKLGRWEKKG